MASASTLCHDTMNGRDKTSVTLLTLMVLFLGLAAAFFFNLWGRPVASLSIPLVSTNFLDKATARQSYADLIKAGEDLSDFDCYACHDKGKPPRCASTPIRISSFPRSIPTS